MKTTVPQIGVIHDLNFEHFPEDLPKAPRNYLKKYFPLFAKKATALLTVSNFSKQDIVDRYGVPPEKITVAHNGASEKFVPIAAAEQQAVRQKFTGGSPYFVYVGALHPRKNIKRLLLAFDAFKKNTNSPTKLLVVGTPLWKDASFKKTYESLVFKADLIFAGHLKIDELTAVTASAKALVLVSYFEGFGIPIIEAMQCHTPVLAGNKTALPEVAGDAALLVDPFDVDAIAEGFLRLDSNAELREKLSQKGIEQAKKFNWDFTADTLWQVIESVSFSKFTSK